MGGQKGDRKSYKATSAAKAAEALASKGGGGGFGGFSGTRPVAGFGFGAPAAASADPAAASSSRADPLELSAQLDGELAQCLRHLSKRDTTTKLKALQNLEEFIGQKTPADLTIMLQPWAYHFKRLLLDPAKSVRMKAAAVMAAVAQAVGKALAPQVKALLGPWYLASFDPYPDAAAAARKSLADVFPGRKQLDALMFCRSEVLAHIAICLVSTPASLGDPKKDTQEELEERHERIVTASLSAAAALLTMMQQAAQQQGPPDQPGSSNSSGADSAAAAAATQEVQAKVSEMLTAPGFFKQKLGSKSAVVQRAAYGFIQAVCSADPQLLKPYLATAAPAVMAALQDKEPTNHPAMWEMLLAFVNSQKPDCWAFVNIQKAIVPRLLSLLRHSCYGSTVTSLPALLPFLAQLPRAAFALQPLLLLDQVLESMWIGQQQQGAAARGDRAATAAVAAAYQECLTWGLRNAASLAGDAAAAAAGSISTSSSTAEVYCRQLQAAGHFSSLLQLAVSSTVPDAQLAADIVQDVLLQQCAAPSSSAAAGNGLPVQLQVLIETLGSVFHLALCTSCQQQKQPSGDTAAPAAACSSIDAAAGTVCLRMQQLLDALSDSSGKHSNAAAAQLAGYCCSALLPMVQAGSQLPAPAANLLARLVRENPGAIRAPPAAAATGAAAGAGAGAVAAAAGQNRTSSSSSSIAALVKLGISSCGGGNDLAAADAELLLSCVAGSSNASAAWGMLLDEVLREGHTVAAWRFVDCLLCQACASSQLRPAAAAAAAGSENWSHLMLDDYIVQLLQQLKQQHDARAQQDSSSSNGNGDGSGGWSLRMREAAAASLLGCCLGANKQQSVLLGADALESCMETIATTLATTLQQQQQQQQEAPDGAAAACIAALSMVLDTSGHLSSSIAASANSTAIGNTSWSLWQQQPQQLQQVLLLLWQLGWARAAGEGLDGLLAELNLDGSSSSSDGSSDAGSAANSASDSSTSDSSCDEEMAADTMQAAGAAAAGAGDSSSSSSAAAWQALHAAAGRMFTPEVLAMAVTELPEPHAVDLVTQLHLLLPKSLQTAAAGAAAGVDAAVVAGTQLACRVAVVLEGLQGHPEQQQELLLQLLAAVAAWQQWTPLSSSGSGGGLDTWEPVYLLMLQFSSVLVVQAGCDVVMPLHHGHLLPRSSNAADASGASSSSSAAAAAAAAAGAGAEGRLWLRLELLCANSVMQVHAAAVSTAAGAGSTQAALVRCVTAAAAAAERQLVKAAGKGSSGAASAVARSQLSAALAQLLPAASSACTAAAGRTSDCSAEQVYSHALQQLLGRTVAAVSASAAARVHLQPVLEQFVQQQVCPAVLLCAQQADSLAGEALLAPVLEVCAQAFRFTASDDAALLVSGFAELSVQLMHKATALPAAAAAGGEGAGGVPLPLLQLAVACFPIQRAHQQQQERAAICTAAERQGLAALLRHVCSGASPSSSFTTAAAAVELQCRLQLCCVSYCWGEMAAAEWHIVLRDAQQRLTTSRREVEKAAGSLAGAVCSAAQQLLGSRGSDNADSMAPAMAIQLLRRLEQKGLLRQQPAVADALMAAATAAVQQLSQLSVLQHALQVLASVLLLQDKVQAAGRAPQLGLALAAAWRELLSLLLALGAVVAVCSSCGTGCSGVLLQYCQEQGSTWLLLQQCLHGCSEADGVAVGKVLTAANDKAEFLGVDAAGSCLALLQQGGFHHHHYHAQLPLQQQYGCAPLQQLAWELLLHPTSLAAITHAATAAADTDETEVVPEYGVSDDAAAYLVKVGLRPEMAGGLAASKPWQQHMLLWALLLAHVGTLRPRSIGQRRLCQALREVPELVPGVLDRVAGLMGLGGSSKCSQAAAAAADAGEVPAAAGVLSAAAQASLSASLQAAGTSGSNAVSKLSGGADAASSIWNVAVSLRSIGLPHSHSSWRLLAAAVYRSVLCMLPASARLWFSDLRDRSRSTAVESYTSRYESPALLAAEFAAIKRDAAGSSGEVGGSCSFRVVANPANREVTAVLEIEDGATLELVVKLPAAAPLKAAEVDCKNKVGIKDGRLRKWLLSIAVFLRNQNQGVLDGISMWKANLEQEFAGVEACLICYSVISAANGQLPRISCKQCNVKFHPACLYKWFRSSGKSTCPHCSALF